jgi:hypothetical protein
MNKILFAFAMTVAASARAQSNITLDGTLGNITAIGTATISGQDANGYSLLVASGINAGNGCILLSGGNVCGPGSGGSGISSLTGDVIAGPDGASTVAYVGGYSSTTIAATVVLAETLLNIKASSGTNADLSVLEGAGAGLTVSTSLVVTGTATIAGLDANGYSLAVASGINAGSGCVLVEGGNICGPVQGPAGPTGAAGAQGPAGMNGLLTFAGNVVMSYVLISTGMNSYDLLTQNTDGTLSVVLTTMTTTTPKFLSNGYFTSWVTADSSDNVLVESPTSITLRFSDLALYDSSFNVWDVSIDSDGVFRTTSVGGF